MLCMTIYLYNNFVYIYIYTLVFVKIETPRKTAVREMKFNVHIADGTRNNFIAFAEQSKHFCCKYW